MEVDVLSIERNDKASGPREAAYDVKTKIGDQDGAFEVLVTSGKIGPDPISYAVFRDPARCVSSGTTRGRSPTYSGAC